MSEETLVVVCPNPKCRREIEEPIILTILSVTPSKKYKACPYCFSKLEPEPPIEQKDIPEPTVEQQKEVTEKQAAPSQSVNSLLEKVKDSGPRFLQKVKVLIPGSNGSEKEKREKTERAEVEPTSKKEEEKTTKEELNNEPAAKEAPKEEPKTVSSDKKERETTGCPESFGYLANRPSDTPIPPQCLVCPKMVDCMLSPRESETS